MNLLKSNKQILSSQLVYLLKHNLNYNYIKKEFANDVTSTVK